MRVLLIKTSSLGDIVHTFPALTDAMQALPSIQFDWVVEEAFADIAAQHPAVHQVLPCALRRWRKAPLRTWRTREWGAFKKQLTAQKYDLVLDAQGLIKSAMVTRKARGPKVGLDKNSAREPLSARVLDRGITVAKGQHAITRLRELFASALGYPLPLTAPQGGLPRVSADTAPTNAIIFFHGTTWATKHWPLAYWQALAASCAQKQWPVLLPWGNDEEKRRADEIAAHCATAQVLPQMSLGEMLDLLRTVDKFVAVDTGLAHLAAIAGASGVALYGPTDPVLTGLLGEKVINLPADFPCAPCLQEKCRYKGPLGDGIEPPCFSALPPDKVWQHLNRLSVRDDG